MFKSNNYYSYPSYLVTYLTPMEFYDNFASQYNTIIFAYEYEIQKKEIEEFKDEYYDYNVIIEEYNNWIFQVSEYENEYYDYM
ncbi:hypothetical protein [Dasineura jujubifolia toursvirus 2a]|nr:hypothetical protein [Dasineura jujubifolia toursvirus 2a]